MYENKMTLKFNLNKMHSACQTRNIHKMFERDAKSEGKMKYFSSDRTD